MLFIDETGDCKKGTSTDYVKRQYIGNVGKTETGIVAVTADGLVDGMIVPLTFAVYKPRERLQDNEADYRTPGRGDLRTPSPPALLAPDHRPRHLARPFHLIGHGLCPRHPPGRHWQPLWL